MYNTKTSLSLSKRHAHTAFDVAPQKPSESGVFRDEMNAELAQVEAELDKEMKNSKSVVSGRGARLRPVLGGRVSRCAAWMCALQRGFGWGGVFGRVKPAPCLTFTQAMRPSSVPVLPDVVGGPGKHLGVTRVRYNRRCVPW